MIYTAPIESITWQAVEDFLAQRVKEGSTLDYKSNWPDNLERTIAAMANTLGGAVLIGVEEAIDGSPKVPPVGVEFVRGMEERVTNIVLSNITPPLFPAVAVCPNATRDRAVMVIRVPQSHQTPHAIMGNRRVYVRTGNVSKPEELATVGEIEWLREHRAKALTLRDTTYRSAIDRSDILMGYTRRGDSGIRMVVPGRMPYLLICAAPYYPREPLITPPNLRPMVREIRIKEYYGTAQEFPIGGDSVKLLQDGIYMLAKAEGETGKRFYYTEFSAIGQVFFRQMLTYEGNTQKLLRASEIFARLDQFLRLAKNYLGRLGFQGLVWFNVLMGSLADTTLGTWELNDQVYTSGPCDDEAITFETSLSMADWDSQSKLAMVEAAEKIAWAYDWELPPQQVDAYLSKHRRV